ncbi:MAG: hypothetical protein AUG51_16080 [Acidobacteria bacterium 13_1_20CM_3_53_8]|nr:MAG: hypothetical protein AUG51_16080 [Acidobacteria bacterium 13_1_20CM_3_53_8]
MDLSRAAGKHEKAILSEAKSPLDVALAPIYPVRKYVIELHRQSQPPRSKGDPCRPKVRSTEKLSLKCQKQIQIIVKPFSFILETYVVFREGDAAVPYARYSRHFKELRVIMTMFVGK